MGIIKRLFGANKVAPPVQQRDAAADAFQEQRPLSGLDTPFRQALLSMYNNEPQPGSDGQVHMLDRNTRISVSQGMWLYAFCCAQRPASIVEIGMAYGFSTLYFLAALAKNGSGHHTAIDPFQNRFWHGVGLTHARALEKHCVGREMFDFVEERSDRAAIDFARAGQSFDMIFIDGNHRFDDVLVDFYLYAPLCNPGGHIVFDDMWMSSIRTVVDFVRQNRTDFVEVPSTEGNISVFRKVAEDRRNWDHFTPFVVDTSANGAE